MQSFTPPRPTPLNQGDSISGEKGVEAAGQLMVCFFTLLPEY